MKVVIVLFVAMLSSSANGSENKSTGYQHMSHPTHAKTSDHITNQLFEEVAPGVYAGQTQVGQETVYFGAEKIDSENVGHWLYYSERTRYLTQDSRGILATWPIFIRQGTEIPYERVKSVSGFTEDEFNAFMTKLKKFVIDNPNGAIAIGKTGTGIAGFQIEPDGNSYVIYASRKPVTGRYPFPKDLPKPITLKQYYEFFSDILMIVRSDVKNRDSYWNRGIFKNPISFIEDEKRYPGLSLKLHGFSAVVFQALFPDKVYMAVAPAPAMKSILFSVKGWQHGDFLISGKDFLDHTPEELEAIKKSGEEPGCDIKITALIRIFEGG